MKIALFLSIICALNSALSQTGNKPVINYESLFKEDSVVFHVGTHLVFEQHCTDKAPRIVANGPILFNRFVIAEIQSRLLVTFQDTLIAHTAYLFDKKEIDNACQLFRIDRKAFQRLDEHCSIYTTSRQNVLITCLLFADGFLYKEDLLDH